MSAELSAKNLNDLTKVQFAELQQLKVSEIQEVLGKSFLESLDDWEIAPRDQVVGLCFLTVDQPVGLALFKRAPRNQSQVVSIHGLKIAMPWQRRGWGHLAFRLAVDQLKEAWPETEILKLSVDAENSSAIAVYHAFGMSGSGPVSQGSNGQEHHIEVSLTS